MNERLPEVQADATASASLAMAGETGAATALLDEYDGDNQTKKLAIEVRSPPAPVRSTSGLPMPRNCARKTAP